MTQKELKEMYMNIICAEVWDTESMRKFAKNNCAYVVQLSNGCIIDIDKPRIQKNFCFGAGMYASATDEEMKKVEKMVDHALKSTEYFKAENLKGLNNEIEQLEEAKAGKYEVYSYLHYMGQKSGSKLKAYSVTRICNNPEWNPGYWSNYIDLVKLENEDIQRIINGLLEVRKAFAKRLDTYLKKYGTSKVNAWSYICD